MRFLNFLFGSKESNDGSPKVKRFRVITDAGDFEMEVRGDGRISQKMIKEALQQYAEKNELEEPPDFISYWDL